MFGRKPKRRVVKKNRVTKPKKERKKIIINFLLIKKVLFCLLVVSVIGFVIYSCINIFSIDTVDSTKNSLSRSYLLAEKRGDMDSTLVVFENGEGSDRRISDVYLFLSNGKKDYSLLVYIPSYIYFDDVNENFGNKVPVSSLRYAGDYLEDGKGIEYSLWQLNQLLGIRYQNYIWFSSESMELIEDVYGDIEADGSRYVDDYVNNDDNELSNGFFKLHSLSSRLSGVKTFFRSYEVKNLNGKIYSNLSFIKVMNFIGSYDSVVGATETYAYDLSSSTYISKDEESSSGMPVAVLNESEFDGSFRDFYSKVIDSNLEKENVRIEVYNGSGISGAAYQFGRKIVNSGCDVVRYENAPSDIERTVVYVPDMGSYNDSYGVVAELLLDRFDLVEGRPSFMTTGDIVIVLGKDISSMYSF